MASDNEQAMTMLRRDRLARESRGVGQESPGKEGQDHGIWASGL